jgi:pimeloyl-ACP methyl ester carboxylesterase
MAAGRATRWGAYVLRQRRYGAYTAAYRALCCQFVAMAHRRVYYARAATRERVAASALYEAWALDGAGSLTAAINWYRCIFSHNAAYHAEIGMEAPASIRAPLLNVWGEDDSALGGRAMADAAARYAQPGAFTLALVPRCSHWTQQDAVLETLHAVAAFLGMRVPAAMRPPPDAYAVSGAPLPTPAADAPMLHNVLEFAGE